MKLTPKQRLSFWLLLGLTVFTVVLREAGGVNLDGVEPVILPTSEVAIVQSDRASAAEIDYEEIKAMIREAVELAGGFSDLIFDGATVVIKPNLVNWTDYTRPGWGGEPLPTEVNGVTTDWRVTKAVVELVRELNPSGKVYVMEGSSVPTRLVMEKLKYTPEYIPGTDGILAIEEDSGGWRDYDSTGIVAVDLPDGLLHKRYYLNKKYKEADVVISLPCLKNHWHAAVTGAIKNVGIGATPGNIYGNSSANPGRNSMVDHNSRRGDLHMWIHDYYKCRPVDFVIMDGLQGIQNGPTPCYEVSRTMRLSKDQMNMRLILAGRDAVAVDTVEALIMNWDPQSVKYLVFLNRSGLGNICPSAISVKGKRVDEIRKDFAGVRPPAGGHPIKKMTTPAFAYTGYEVQEGRVLFSLVPESSIVKMELCLNGEDRPEQVITGDFHRVAVDLSRLNPGENRVTIHAYDRFFNRVTKTFLVRTKPQLVVVQPLEGEANVEQQG
ncbi:MAG: DUF362 domain-containing protein [Firmicutes bacterium]|nr:DUF362 domain-containing protein [Bacillota bacterium]